MGMKKPGGPQDRQRKAKDLRLRKCMRSSGSAAIPAISGKKGQQSRGVVSTCQIWQ
eukprot:gene3043-2127_t